ncbi:MAG: LysE family transporter [Firmicutes bacterium]|nr:LysE family transporter [Bacillota bacterium]
MNLGAILLSSFLIGLSGAMVPGGLLIVNINETIKRGLPGGMIAITGHALIELLAVAGLALGLGTILGRPAVVGTIAIAGGALLAWMAVGTAKTSREAELAITTTESVSSTAVNRFGPLAAGTLATISNPYWALWWTSVGATYVAMAMEQGSSALGAFYIGHIASDYAWYFLVSLALVTGKKLISQKVYQGLLLAGSIFLAILAVYFVFSGAKLLLSS